MPGQVQFGAMPAAAGLSIQELALAGRRGAYLPSN